MEAWYKDGKRHRDDGPAIQFFAMPREYWYKNGILEREIWYDDNGLPYDEYVWIDGKKKSIY